MKQETGKENFLEDTSEIIDKSKKVFIFTMIFIFILLCIHTCKTKAHNELQKTLQKNTKDSLELYINKYNESSAKIDVLESDNTEAFLNLATAQGTIVKLQKLVEKNKKALSQQGSAIVVSTEGTLKGTVETKVSVDTLSHKEEKSVVYEANFKFQNADKTKTWAWGSITAKKDSTSVDLHYKEDLEIVIGKEKTGFLGFGKGKMYGNVTSLSPYSSIKEFRVYSKIPPPSSKVVIGPTLSYGLGSNFLFSFYAGIGATYKIIEF